MSSLPVEIEELEKKFALVQLDCSVLATASRFTRCPLRAFTLSVGTRNSLGKAAVNGTRVAV